MQCAHCGYANRPQALYCAHCGQALAQVNEAPHPAQEESEGASAPIEEGEGQSNAQALAPGEILAGRYEILEVIEAEVPAPRRRYRARDLGRCARCGAEDNAPEAEYCAHCGAALDDAPVVTLIEEEPPAPEGCLAQFQDRGYAYYVVRDASPGRAEPPQPASWEWRYAVASDVGRVRDLNEDCAEAHLYTESGGHALGVFIVADGLGGQDSGEVASRLAAAAVWEGLRERVWLPILRGDEMPSAGVEEALCEVVRAANERVYAARTLQASQMSTTLTVALVVDAEVYIAHVGDSRAYRWGARGLERITKDHSLVQRLLDAGQISPGEVYTHPQRNLIYHSIGDQPHLEVDILTLTLEEGDGLILCSDGLWESVRDEGLEEVLLAEPEPEHACRRLIEYANLAGGEDNVSVIVAQLARKTL